MSVLLGDEIHTSLAKNNSMVLMADIIINGWKLSSLSLRAAICA